MQFLTAAARMISDRLAFFCAGTPLLGLAMGAISGALGSSLGVGWLSLLFLIGGLVLSRAGVRWKSAIFVVTLLVFWRGNFQEVPQFGERSSRAVNGELEVGRMLTNWSGERVGYLLREGGIKNRVAIQNAEELDPGVILKIEGLYFKPSIARNPSEFSVLDFWEQNRIEAGVDLETHAVIGTSWRTLIWRYAEKGRIFLRNSVTRGVEHPEAQAIIVAVILGETPGSNSEITKAFRHSGAMHLFAVSGLHVTMVGALIWGVLLFCRVPRRKGVAIIIFGSFGYALITGGNPPAMRASLMAAIYLSAFLLRRRPSLFNALALSVVVVLLWNPAQIEEVGFQLSYGVVSAIALGYRLTYRVFGRIAEIDPFKPQRLLTSRENLWVSFRGKIASLMATSLAAWIGSLPWMAMRFGLITPVAVFASVVLVPLTFAILGVGFLATMVGMVSPKVGELLNQGNGYVARSSYLAARGFAEIPFGHHRMSGLEPADWVVFDLADGGAASFLSIDSGVMIDIGNNRKYQQIVRPSLRRWDKNPQSLFVTHPDGKHSGAINSFEQDFSPKQTFLPVIWSRSPSYRDYVGRGKLKARGITTANRRYLYHLSDEVSLRVIKDGDEELDTVGDSRGMALMVNWDGWNVLVMGDLGVEEERELIKSGVDLSADVLLIGQHVHTYSGSSEFLRATGANVVIKSAAGFPSFQTPTKRWLKMCEEFGVEVFNQGETGAVLMDFSEEELVIRSFLQSNRVFHLRR